MRRNIFLHFLNRDTREIFGVYKTLGDAGHRLLMRRALNAAVALCEDRCIAPPGFIVEDQIAFELAENQQAYLKEGVLQFPMRESNLAEFADKKRVGYQLMRDRYSGLFNDTRIGFLGKNAIGIIPRRSHITEVIVDEWQGGPDSGLKVWKNVKGLLTPENVDLVAKIPFLLNEEGTALTWSAIEPKIPPDARNANTDLRDTLQHIYFRQYCNEFKLVTIVDIPHILRNFLMPHDGQIYSYHRFGSFLDAFDMRDFIFDAPADLIVDLRKKAGFIAFMDAYANLAKISATNADLQFFAGRARDATKYDWNTIRTHKTGLFELSPVEVSELAHVLHEAANAITTEKGLPRRGEAMPDQKPNRSTATSSTGKIILMPNSEPDLILFVALQEELDVLAKQLGLERNAQTPQATGAIGDVQVDVVCPRNMGRVAAAVAMANYLAKRKNKPKLILVVGIAGGFVENGSNQGHIISVTKVIDLALRKVIDGSNGSSPKFRREDYRMTNALGDVLQSDLFDVEAWSNESCGLGWPKDRRPSLHFGPMASADEIVSSNDWRRQMMEAPGGESKLLGVEMEAGGVCAAATDIAVCMLRVISDQADPSKTDDSWRQVGMKTLANLLRSLPLRKVLESI